jgi:dTDP-4-amino-4,6-dideoxy-D-glucose acyltransferase
MTSFYSLDELKLMGFKSIGSNVLISRKASFYGTAKITIGNHVRIDDFCVLSAGTSIQLGNYIHIGCYTSLIGSGKIVLSDYCSISGRVSIYSSSDDYSGIYMTNPMVPFDCIKVTDGDVILHKHVIIGCGSTLLPNVILEEGVAIGAMSLVNQNCKSFTIYSGNPAKKIIPRSKNLLEIEKKIKHI